MKLASVAPTKQLMQSLRRLVTWPQSSSHSELRHVVLLAAAAVAVRRVRRLGLVGLVGVEEGEDRALGLDEVAGQAIGLGHHFADLRIGLRGCQIAGADRAEAIDLMDDHEAHGAPGQRITLEPDRQLRSARPARSAEGSDMASSRMSRLAQKDEGPPCGVKAGPASWNPACGPTFHTRKGALLGAR